MKTALIAVAALVAALVLPVVASAQDWVMDWHSTGNVAGPPFTWDITGTSPASLTPMTGPPTFTGQAFNLSFTNLGRTFGGLVGQGSFQPVFWRSTGALDLRGVSAVGEGDRRHGFRFSDSLRQEIPPSTLQQSDLPRV